MAIGIALAAEEHGKIVSARHFCNAVKSYLPTHGTFHKIAHCALCIFADAIRKECVEAKLEAAPEPKPKEETQFARSVPRQSRKHRGNVGLRFDAIRKECAEAKQAKHLTLAGLAGRNPQGVHRGKGKM